MVGPSDLDVKQAFYYIFRDMCKAYYEEKQRINVGGNPMVRCECVWAFPYLPGNRFVSVTLKSLHSLLFIFL